jgi:hypothetical protein
MPSRQQRGMSQCRLQRRNGGRDAQALRAAAGQATKAYISGELGELV